MKDFLLITFAILFFCGHADAQFVLNNDNFKSEDVIVCHIGKVEMKELGHLKKVKESIFTLCPNDTTLNVIFYHYFSPHVIYIQYADTLHLHYVTFSRSKISLSYNDFTFSKRTTIDDVLYYFQLNQTFIDSTRAFMTPLSNHSKKQIYHIVLRIGDSKRFNTMDLFFSKKKKLLVISFPVNCF